MIKLGPPRTLTRFDVAQAFTPGQLRKSQTQKLVPAGEIFDVAIAVVAIDAKLKRVGREKIRELRKDGSAKVHRLPPEQAGKQ
jgi:hypothetical protein